MTSPVIRKLRHGAPLSPDDERALAAACKVVRPYAAREDVISEGERPHDVHAVLEGFACRYKMLPDGGRQIMAFLVPGDFCDLHVAILGTMDHGIEALAPSRIAAIAREEVDRLTRTSPALTRAFWWATLVDEAVLREWLVGMGRRSADQQVAHLVCELLQRLRAVGLAPGDRFDLPLTQAELADAVGLTPVHVNRVVQHLRGEGFLEWRGGVLTVLDEQGLTAFADFDPNYLHLRAAAAV
ncbi:Crp/Fnr family transcriptional regulator [Phenylobacterium sp.]|uniref:Crp/Fnr family transcriptional regulator n=1 Tax=Phenylobacterium sp. TaxID=1871053 RepID=UPI002D0D18A5|nr:Crp/Fnr family transcriptional regulator [Phenylobacterium sp.]HVI30840.1 Crp/Fnr family transcriptional regulator [Phenylobacterium sp.]